jgi:hypothetical protein
MTNMTRQTQIILGVVAALVLFGGGYATGMTIGRGSATDAVKDAAASPSGAAGRVGAGGAGVAGRAGAGGAAGQQIVAGRVLSVNDGSITVEVRTGGGQGASPTVTSQIVLVGTSTRIVKTTETDIKASDLKANDQIQIVGTTDASGNVAATAIIVGANALQQLLGGAAGFGGPGGAGGAGASGRPTPSPSPTR